MDSTKHLVIRGGYYRCARAPSLNLCSMCVSICMHDGRDALRIEKLYVSTIILLLRIL